MKLLSLVFLGLSLVLSHSSWAGPVASLAGMEKARPRQYEQVNQTVRKKLNIPFFFNVPVSRMAPLPAAAIQGRGDQTAEQVILFPYRETSARRAAKNQLGLRLAVINGSKPRAQTSQLLATTGLLETGDILLTFRPEWYETLRYSHIQLGVSHAGVVYVDKDAGGKISVFNLDMPLNEEMLGAGLQGQLGGKHYLEAPLVHVLRPRGLSAVQKKNLLSWLKLIHSRAKSAYGTKITFNQDYASPKFERDKPLAFVGDLGRIALGKAPQQTLSVYCSEFAWSVLSLRNCDPARDAAAFATEAAPTCISPIFDPMKVLGTVTTTHDASAPGETVGMVDGPVLLTDAVLADRHDQKLRNEILRRIFASADGAPEKISAGHKAVEATILKSSPDFYDKLKMYYELTGLPKPQEHPAFSPLFQGFNASQRENYSPTAFQVHAILPAGASMKAFDYILTLTYLPGADYNKLRALTFGQ